MAARRRQRQSAKMKELEFEYAASACAGDRRALALEAFGMWAGRPDIDDEWLARGRARWRSDFSAQDERQAGDRQ